MISGLLRFNISGDFINNCRFCMAHWCLLRTISVITSTEPALSDFFRSKLFLTMCQSSATTNSFFTARVAKRAKFMFSQVFVILSLNGGGGGVEVGNTNGQPPPLPWDQVRTSTPPPWTRSEHLTPPGPGQNIYPLPP